MPDAMTDQEMLLQRQRRAERVEDFANFFNELTEWSGGVLVREKLMWSAQQMNLEVVIKNDKTTDVKPILVPVKTKPAPPRSKKMSMTLANYQNLTK